VSSTATTEVNSNATGVNPTATLDIARPLAGSMDQAIGEATVVMGTLVTELMRRSLRGGVLKVGEQLESYVGGCVDQTIAERRPAIEQAAAAAAEQTAINTAAKVAGEKVLVLEQRTTEVTRTLAVQIEEADHRAQQTTREVANELSGRLEEKAQRLAGEIEEKGQQLTARIEEGDRQAIQVTRDTARELSEQIEVAEKRVSQATQADMQQRVEELLEKSRRGTRVLKARIETLTADLAELGQQLARECEARAEVTTCLDRLALDLGQENKKLVARVAELERPRGLRRLWTWLFGRRKRPAAD
jgi:hypothetical protein